MFKYLTIGVRLFFLLLICCTALLVVGGTALIFSNKALSAMEGVDGATSRQALSALQTTVALEIAIAVLVLIFLTVLISRSITRPLVYVSQRLAAGDVKNKIGIRSGGELGQLLDSLRELFFSIDQTSYALSSISKGNLSVVTDLRSNTGSLVAALQEMLKHTRKAVVDIRGEVDRLALSAQQVAGALVHISPVATETATAVTETTTTVEELKQMANLTLEKARDVLANAQDTVQSVTSSEVSVKETIDDMNQIRDRMQTISDTILKLSEKGMAIAEVMDTVNDIAEQSNLLAVNAAIEAAKAGEYGRSFTVVAQEIRTLAEQSKGATIQVRALLMEIQNATNTAVLATEQGSKAVAKGVKQSLQTSQAIASLATKMAQVTQATNQIVMSHEQQLIGTEQINFAMTQISEATRQHVEYLKEVEVGVKTLDQVGVTLKKLMDRYQLPEPTKQIASNVKTS